MSVSTLTLCDRRREYSNHVRALANVLSFLSSSVSKSFDDDDGHGCYLLLNQVRDELIVLSDFDFLVSQQSDCVGVERGA